MSLLSNSIIQQKSRLSTVNFPREIQIVLTDLVASVKKDKPIDILEYIIEYFTKLQSRNLPNVSLTPKQVELLEGDQIRWHRRGAIFYGQAPPMSEYVVEPKTPEELEQISETLKQCILFKHFDEFTLFSMMQTFRCFEVDEGDCIIKEGEIGDFFFVIDYGQFEVLKKEKKNLKLLKTLTDGGFFGELALLHDHPRTYSVIARTNGKVWLLERRIFKDILHGKVERNKKIIEKAIGQISYFSDLTDEQRDELVSSAEIIYYGRGDTVFSKFEPAKGMYVVLEGKVDICKRKVESDEMFVFKTREQGDYFGSLSLIAPCLRISDAKARTPVNLAFISIDNIHRLLPKDRHKVSKYFEELDKEKEIERREKSDAMEKQKDSPEPQYHMIKRLSQFYKTDLITSEQQ